MALLRKPKNKLICKRLYLLLSYILYNINKTENRAIHAKTLP